MKRTSNGMENRILKTEGKDEKLHTHTWMAFRIGQHKEKKLQRKTGRVKKRNRQRLRLHTLLWASNLYESKWLFSIFSLPAMTLFGIVLLIILLDIFCCCCCSGSQSDFLLVEHNCWIEFSQQTINYVQLLKNCRKIYGHGTKAQQ